jgi:DNA-directed RNA polymerase II subunit RPB11
LWAQLLNNPEVLFAGYKIPHPLEQKMVIKVETVGGKMTPKKALKKAIDQVSALFMSLDESFKYEMSDKYAGDRGSMMQEDYY